MCGNTNKLGDAADTPGRVSFLFNTDMPLESICSAIGVYKWQSVPLFGTSGAFSSALENPRARFIYTFGRTHNRIRSPR